MAYHLLKISRLESLTDGIFAIAMTILALDLRLPRETTLENLHAVFTQLIVIKLFIYIGSFITLGTLWVAMNFQLGLLERLNRPYLWMNIFYLMAICVIPFSANFLVTYPTSPLSIDFYAGNLLFTSLGQLLTIQTADAFKLNKDVYTPAIRWAAVKRILLAPFFWVSAVFIGQWNTLVAFSLLLIPTLMYILPGRIDKFETL